MQKKLMTKKKKKSPSNDNSKKAIIKKIIIGTAVGLGLFYGLMLIFSAITVKVDLSESIKKILPFIAIALSSFVGGYVSCRMIKNNGFINGSITASAEMLLICISLFLFNDNIGLKTAVAFLIMLITGAIGGILAVSKKTKRKI